MPKDRHRPKKSTLRAFVLMPSGSHGEYEGGEQESQFVYKHIIRPAIKRAGKRLKRKIKVRREVDNREPGEITKRIVTSLAASDIAIVDITGENPNVFLELGVRFALREKITILLRRREARIPFDIAVYRHVTYEPFQLEDAVRHLARAIVGGMNDESADSLVYDTFPSLRVSIPNVYTSRQHSGTTLMPWEDFWDRIVRVRDLLEQNERYAPHVIVGISNGGMVVADLLGRHLFRSPQLICLWQRRTGEETSERIFASHTNRAALLAIRHDEDVPTEILLVDDNAASGETAVAARTYVQAVLSDKNISVKYLPLFRRTAHSEERIGDFLIYNQEHLGLNLKAGRPLMDTHYTHLPYNKEIRVGHPPKEDSGATE